MGGEERTSRIKALLTELREKHCCRLCVLTRGETASLRIFFEKVVPDWAPLFEGGWIANTFNDYFTVSPSPSSGGPASGEAAGYSLSLQTPNLSTVGRYGECTKEMILEAVFPFVRPPFCDTNRALQPEGCSRLPAAVIHDNVAVTTLHRRKTS